jgi:hypothetical protein
MLDLSLQALGDLREKGVVRQSGSAMSHAIKSSQPTHAL